MKIKLKAKLFAASKPSKQTQSRDDEPVLVVVQGPGGSYRAIMPRWQAQSFVAQEKLLQGIWAASETSNWEDPHAED